MKRRTIAFIFLALAAVLLIAFFPVKNTRSISGEGAVLKMDQEKIGVCNLNIEIHTVKSLTVPYRRTFSFTLDGERLTEFVSSHCSETADACFISQMYYDERKDQINSCDLFYRKDLSFAKIHWNDKLYVISK